MARHFLLQSLMLGMLAGGLTSTISVALGDQVAVLPSSSLESHSRAGYPQRVAHFAFPSNTRHYGWYYVGGGSVFGGEPRLADEGTFGWDYSGILFNKSVALSWTHGRRYQGGTGRYRTVGPAPLHTQ